jgi:hypothetical protein
MCPYPYDSPASSLKTCGDPSIASDVCRKLVVPPSTICLRLRLVLGAPVPKAPIDEYG